MQTNKIQIITIDNIRYVGNLHNISEKDKSVELRNITSYGTEDRCQAEDTVPKNETIIDIEWQIFEGKQIKELKVLKVLDIKEQKETLEQKVINLLSDNRKQQKKYKKMKNRLTKEKKDGIQKIGLMQSEINNLKNQVNKLKKGKESEIAQIKQAGVRELQTLQQDYNTKLALFKDIEQNYNKSQIEIKDLQEMIHKKTEQVKEIIFQKDKAIEKLSNNLNTIKEQSEKDNVILRNLTEKLKKQITENNSIQELYTKNKLQLQQQMQLQKYIINKNDKMQSKIRMLVQMNEQLESDAKKQKEIMGEDIDLIKKVRILEEITQDLTTDLKEHKIKLQQHEQESQKNIQKEYEEKFMKTPGDHPFEEEKDENIQIFENQDEISQPLNEQKLNILPVIQYKVSNNREAENCIICSLDFEEGNRVTILPCLHKYHQQCVGQWLGYKGICPKCQLQLQKE